MPKSATEALKGMLADGVQADEVLNKLQSAGYDIKPPSGDDSYGEPAGLIIGIASEPEEAEEEDSAPEPPKGGDQSPLNRYQKAARAAMSKDKGSEDEEPTDE